MKSVKMKFNPNKAPVEVIREGNGRWWKTLIDGKNLWVDLKVN